MRERSWGGGGVLRGVEPYRQRPAAFTVIEVLVASAVLALLLVLLLQMANYTLQASRVTTQKLNATQAARRVIDTLSSDLAGAVSNGATVLYQPDGGSVSLSLVTAGRGPANAALPTRFLAVNYRLAGYQIIRSYEAVGWNVTDWLTAAAAAGTSTNRSLLAPGILQFAVLALLEDGTTAVVLASGTSIPPSALTSWRVPAGGMFEGQVVPADWSALVRVKPPSTLIQPRVRALLAAIAAVDEQNFQLLSESQRDLFAQPLTADPVKEWETVLNGASLPGSARTAIRFYSKILPLP